MATVFHIPDSRAVSSVAVGARYAMESAMIRPDTYESFAYETGFGHALDGYVCPDKTQCDRFYWLGYCLGKESIA